MSTKKQQEVVDYEKVTKEQLATARRKLKALGDNLENTKTLASDLLRIREQRLIIDDCKRRSKDAA